MANTIDNSDDVIDSRDIIERIEELESDRENLVEELREAEEQKGEERDEEDITEKREALQEFDDSSEGDELTTLKALAEEGEQYSEWVHGECLIRESYFEEYMDQMIEDCYELPKDLPAFITLTLDYEALQMDYTELDFNGITYFIRCC